MRLFKPPQALPEGNKVKVFLAGSISDDKADPYQSKMEEVLSDLDIDLFNPRRDAWDSSWEQKATNPEFRGQVEWELSGLEQSDIILCYFDPKTQSPVTLLELGIYATTGKLIVYCPDGFWRKGNVDIVAERYKIQTASSWEDFCNQARTEIKDLIEFVESGKGLE